MSSTGAHTAAPPPKAPGTASSPSRKHASLYFANYICRGVTKDMEDRRRVWLEDKLLEETMSDVRGSPEKSASPSSSAAFLQSSTMAAFGEVNKNKIFALAGDPSTNPPYHIVSDDGRVRASGALLRTSKKLQEQLTAADANHDGKVSYHEFVATLSSLDPTVPNRTYLEVARALDPEDTGKVLVADAVAALSRRLATKPSQRGTLSAADPLAWASAEALANAGSRRQFVLEQTESHDYYSLRLPEMFGRSLPGSSAPPSRETGPASSRPSGSRHSGRPTSTRATQLRDGMRRSQMEYIERKEREVSMTRSGTARSRVAPSLGDRTHHHGGLIIKNTLPVVAAA